LKLRLLRVSPLDYRRCHWVETEFPDDVGVTLDELAFLVES